MKLIELQKSIDDLFDTTGNDAYGKESGITVSSNREIKRIGYCVNLTMKTVQEAVKRNVDLMVTHHDAWEFISGMKEVCTKALERYDIGHYFNHLPLDDCRFGTNERLSQALGLVSIEKDYEYEGFYCGRTGIHEPPIAFEQLVGKMETILGEPVKSWKFNDRPVNKIGIVCGGGDDTELVKKTYENVCDVYITGEKNLYTVQYAQFLKMNLIVGSHTFIELLGVEGLAKEIKKKHPDIEIINLKEEHIE